MFTRETSTQSVASWLEPKSLNWTSSPRLGDKVKSELGFAGAHTSFEFLSCARLVLGKNLDFRAELGSGSKEVKMLGSIVNLLQIKKKLHVCPTLSYVH